MNCCVHNDYSTHLGPSVFIYDDHIEFLSYGNPLERQSKEKFLLGISNPFNPELAMLLLKLGIIEQSGKGINTILRKYSEDVFVFSKNYLQVVIPYNNLFLKEIETNDEAKKEAINKDESAVLELIKKYPSITREQLSFHLNKSCSTIYKVTRKLQRNGIIFREGSKKSGYWIIDSKRLS